MRDLKTIIVDTIGRELNNNESCVIYKSNLTDEELKTTLSKKYLGFKIENNDLIKITACYY